MGLITLLKLKDKRAFILSFFICFAHIIFSYFNLYPVNSRLIFYWFVFLPICVGSLVSCVCGFLEFKSKHLCKIIMPVLFCLCVILYFYCNRFPVYLNDRYPKRPLSFIEKRYVLGDIVVPQRWGMPHEYLCKYYIHTIPENAFSEITDKNWKVSLTKGVEYISSLKKFNRVWFVFNSENPGAVVSELKKNKTLKKKHLKVSSCKKINKQVVCLVQRKKAH